MSDLNDKEWRSSNPSFKDRITDISANIKTMLDQPPERDHNLDISEDENDPQELGYKNDDKSKQNKIQLNLKDKSTQPQKNSTAKPKVELKQQTQPDLLGLDNDDFDDFVSHRATTEGSVSNVSSPVHKTSPQVPTGASLLDLDIGASNANSNISPSLNLFQSNNNNNNNTKQSANLLEDDLFGAPVQSKPVPSAQANLNLFDAPIAATPSNTAAATNASNDFDLFNFGDVSSKPMPSSVTMPNFNMAPQKPMNNITPVSDDFAFFGEEKKSESVQNSNNTNTNINKSASMWDDLSKTVDINLDSLSPHSKGAKVNKQSSVPLNSLLQNNLKLGTSPATPSKKSDPFNFF